MVIFASFVAFGTKRRFKIRKKGNDAWARAGAHSSQKNLRVSLGKFRGGGEGSTVGLERNRKL